VELSNFHCLLSEWYNTAYTQHILHIVFLPRWNNFWTARPVQYPVSGFNVTNNLGRQNSSMHTQLAASISNEHSNGYSAANRANNCSYMTNNDKPIKQTVTNNVGCKNKFTTRYYMRLMALCPGLPRWARTRKVKLIWILLKQLTVASAGPYASLHLAPDR